MRVLRPIFRALAIVLPAAPALAQAPEVRVTVQCPALDPEVRAALESRSKADLLVRHESGALTFACAETGVVTWEPAAGKPLSERVVLSPYPDGVIEQFLETADRLIQTSHEPATGPQSAEPAVVGASSPSAPTPSPPPPEMPETPETEPLPPQEAPERQATPLPVAFVAAGVAELWRSLPALGPALEFKWRFLSPFALDAGVTLLFTTEARSEVTARAVRAHVGAELERAPFRIGVRVLVDTLRASPAPELETSARSGTGVGARLHAAYALPLFDALRVAVGPTLTLHAAPLRVDYGATELFRVPVLTAGAEIQFEFGSR